MTVPAGASPADIAARHLDAGRLDQAERIFKDLLARDSRDRDALRGLAGLALRAGNAARAVEIFGALATDTPDDPVCQRNLGVAYQAAGRFDEAELCIRLAVRLDPDAPEGYVNLSNVLSARGETEAAVVAMSHAIALDPDRMEARFGLALLHHKAHRLEMAEAGYRAVIAADDDHVGAWNNIALLFRTTGRTEEAIECLEAVLLRRPGETTAKLNLADVLLGAGRLEAAAKVVRDALTLAPRDPLALACQARVALAMDAPAEAARTLAEAARLAPANPGIAFDLGRTLRRLGRLDAAETALKRAEELLPPARREECMRVRGHVLLSLGRYADAWDLLDTLHAAQGSDGRVEGREALFQTPMRLVGTSGQATLLAVAGLAVLAPANADIRVTCPPLLARLLGDVPVLGEVEALADVDMATLAQPGERLVLADDVPRLLRLTPEDLKGAPPLFPTLEPMATPQPPAGAKIGFWREGDGFLLDWRDSLAGIPYGAFYDLQTGKAGESGLPRKDALHIGPFLQDFHDLARAILAMDVVVAAEGVVATLAVLLGKRTVVLSPAEGHWVFPAGTAKAPWFENTQVLRQSPERSWTAARTTLASVLASL